MQILTRITGGWLTFKDLEKALDVPAVSLRRYHEKFPTYLVGKKVNRSLAFPRESIETFRMISELYKEGLDTATVQATLAMHFDQTVDVKPMPPVEPSAPAPAIPDMMAALLPLAEKYLAVYERQTQALEAIASALGSNSPFKSREQSGHPIRHGEANTGQDGQEMKPVDRAALVREVLKLRGLGYGAARIRTTLVRSGWGSLAGPGKRLSKSTVAKIIKMGLSDA